MAGVKDGGIAWPCGVCTFAALADTGSVEVLANGLTSCGLWVEGVENDSTTAEREAVRGASSASDALRAGSVGTNSDARACAGSRVGECPEIRGLASETGSC